MRNNLTGLLVHINVPGGNQITKIWQPEPQLWPKIKSFIKMQ